MYIEVWWNGIILDFKQIPLGKLKQVHAQLIKQIKITLPSVSIKVDAAL